MAVRACPCDLIRSERRRAMPKLVIEHGIPGAGKTIEPFFREAGTGPGVVCIHSNASTSAQWRGLMDLLAPRFRVFAPDSYDAGKSPPCPPDGAFPLGGGVGLLEPVLTRAGSPLALVGHSYGAAV